MTASKSKTSPRLHIKVTQDVIDTSVQRDSSHCMIADAIKDQVPNARFITVDLATIRFTDLNAGKRYIYLTPRNAQEALLDFDQGNQPGPFNFHLQGASVLITGNGRKGRVTLEPDSRGGGTPPVRVGGDSPPIGPLAGGSPQNRSGKKVGLAAAGAGNRTGRRREFGLRAIIR